MKTYSIASLVFVLSLFVMAPSASAGDFHRYGSSVIPAKRANSLLSRTVPGKRLYLLPACGSSRMIYGYYDAKLPVADYRGIISTRVPVTFVKIEKPVYRHGHGCLVPRVHPRQDFRPGKGVRVTFR